MQYITCTFLYCDKNILLKSNQNKKYVNINIHYEYLDSFILFIENDKNKSKTFSNTIIMNTYKHVNINKTL